MIEPIEIILMTVWKWSNKFEKSKALLPVLKEENGFISNLLRLKPIEQN
jgi:hypothetical protein